MGTPIVVVSLFAMNARIQLDAHKIKIGWVVCRLMAKQNVRRCQEIGVSAVPSVLKTDFLRFSTTNAVV